MPTETMLIDSVHKTFSPEHNKAFIEGLFAATKMFNELLQTEGREAVLEVRHSVTNSVVAAAWIGRNDE